jgi:hypothetical protein
MNGVHQLPTTCLLFLLHASTFAAPVQFLRTPGGGIQPQAAVDSKDVVHLIYFKGDPKGGDVFYVRREPGASELSKPLPVNCQPHTSMAIGTIRGPQLAIGKEGRPHVVWDGMGEGVAAAGAPVRHPLFYTRLNDAGTAFEPERNVITYAYGLDGGSSVAADLQGNVYAIWHAPQPGGTNGEADRAVFVARSNDEGKTFSREARAISEPTGACGCCGLRAFADSGGAVYILYRAASMSGTRDETLLRSRGPRADFEIAYSHQWKLGSCPMSSASLSETATSVLAGAETHGRVFFIRLDRDSGRISAPVSPEARAKYPIAVGNAKGEVLLVWAEGTGWGKGGSVVWQIYDRNDEPSSQKGRAEGLAAWSMPAAFVGRDGRFTIVY